MSGTGSNVAELDRLMVGFPWKLEHMRNCGHSWMGPGGKTTPWSVEACGFGQNSFRVYGQTAEHAIVLAILKLGGTPAPAISELQETIAALKARLAEEPSVA